MIEFTVPIRTKTSAVNLREHWSVRKRRVKAERDATAISIRVARGRNGMIPPAPPLEVHLTRFGPTNGLDSDNLTGSLKAIRDQIAEWLGVDDRSEAVQWRYAQVRTKYDWGVKVKIVESEHQ